MSKKKTSDRKTTGRPEARAHAQLLSEIQDLLGDLRERFRQDSEGLNAFWGLSIPPYQQEALEEIERDNLVAARIHPNLATLVRDTLLFARTARDLAEARVAGVAKRWETARMAKTAAAAKKAGAIGGRRKREAYAKRNARIVADIRRLMETGRMSLYDAVNEIATREHKAPRTIERINAGARKKSKRAHG
jgi:hypothetical protein